MSRMSGFRLASHVSWYEDDEMKCSASSKTFHPLFQFILDEDELREMEERNESDPKECEDATHFEGRSLCSRTPVRPDTVKGTDLYRLQILASASSSHLSALQQFFSDV
ncbi:hypothetical protein MUK42_30120 [Musa troglodytarum]|uniref:Uncharacterized protein n=1 Tax=Musa troglodytarum TaxID=320322 RepID=A0A9E7GCJ6_9LILI|nr:hypothetical protein MUK42_30120 [Musa troglodytarum]